MEGIEFLGNCKLQWYKLGTSRKINARTPTLVKGLPIQVEVFKTWELPTERRKKLESQLLVHFTPQKERGEWFVPERVERLLLMTLEFPTDDLSECLAACKEQLITGFLGVCNRSRIARQIPILKGTRRAVVK